MRRVIPMIVILALIGCDKAEGGGTTTPSNIKNQTITPSNDKVNKNTAGNYEEYIVPVEMDLDDMSFEEAFTIQHRAKGEGHSFWWRGDEYTTDLLIMLPNNEWYDSNRWVRNSDDLDDRCFSNEFDECGKCDGPGMITWYQDWDDDGLGSPTIYIKACTYPSVDEE